MTILPNIYVEVVNVLRTQLMCTTTSQGDRILSVIIERLVFPRTGVDEVLSNLPLFLLQPNVFVLPRNRTCHHSWNGGVMSLSCYAFCFGPNTTMPIVLINSTRLGDQSMVPMTSPQDVLTNTMCCFSTVFSVHSRKVFKLGDCSFLLPRSNHVIN